MHTINSYGLQTHDNSQCSLSTPDYGYKIWRTDREAPCAYTQPEGIGYLVGTVSHGYPDPARSGKTVQ